MAMLFALSHPALAAGAKAAQGQSIVNTATITSSEEPVPVTSGEAIVRVRIPTPATIELLQYAPTVATAQHEAVAQGAYQAGADPATLVALPLPRPTGGAPIDLSRPIPVVGTGRYHQGDPVFIRVVDHDMNADPLVRETILVTISNDLTGDVEIIQLTEDGPDTGIFLGYVPTVRDAPAHSRHAAATLHDGTLSVVEQSMLTARYTDSSNSSDVVTASAIFDPLSLVFDSHTGQPVNGAAVTVVDVGTGQPAAVFADDGTTTFPSTITSGQPATDGAGRVQPLSAGEFRFPFLPPGTYRYQVKPPAGYIAPSLTSDTDLASLPGGPFTIAEPGSRGEPFMLGASSGARIDIPVDRTSTSLWVRKSASKDRAGVGDFLAYAIAVSNLDKLGPAAGVRAMDTLPVGFRFKRGSAQQDGAPLADPSISSDGRTLVFELGTIAPQTTTTVGYVVQVTAGAAIGRDATNLASASSAAGTASNVSAATVRVGDDFFSTRSLIMGRVTTGTCMVEEGAGTEGLAGVRVVLEDGTFSVSDKKGLFHFEGLRPGLHVVQLDLDSLPEGWEPVSCTRNDRFAGRSFSQFVDVQGGTMWRADFHVRAKPLPVPLPAEPHPDEGLTPGHISLSLTHTAAALTASFAAQLRGVRAPLGEAAVRATLPEGMTYEPGSSALDGTSVADPSVEGATLHYALGTIAATDWKKLLTFRARATADSKAGEGVVVATLLGTAANGEKVHTPPAENTVLVAKEETGEPLKVLVRPHFPSLSAQLAAEDKKELDRVAKSLAKVRPERITVIGYTDSQKIRGNGLKKFKDNTSLSLVRAASVGQYLIADLHLPQEKLSLDGRGEADPIADNRTPEGRAQNRRVEVQVIGATVGQRTVLASVKSESGEAQADVSQAVSAAGGEPTTNAATTAARANEGGSAVAATSSAAGAALPRETGGDAAPTSVAHAGSSANAFSATESGLTPGVPQAPPAPPKDGLISPADGELLADRIVAVQLRAASFLTVTLAVDGKEIDASRIGYKSADPKSGKTIYTYVGIDFGDKGAHTVAVTGTDPFGNVRLKETATVTRVGEVASLRLVSAEGNVADARTPVRMRLELTDREGQIIHGSTRLELREGNLSPLKLEGDNLSLEDAAASRKVSMDKDGWVSFAPVSTSGSYHAVLGAGAATLDAETWARPKMRDWILVGLAEGTAGYDIASGNMESLGAGDGQQDLYANGRVALFAKGQIQGKWLVTMAYDSAKQVVPAGASLFQIIDPQTYYTLYGDASQQGYDAASARKIYLKIEREQFYALFGDYDTGLRVTELSRYSRRLNGVKTELQTKNVEVNAFGARTDQAYARDEIPGDGTSGLYHLSRRQITLNSETVTLLVRDRFRSEVVVSSTTMGRFTDYSIDYDSGTLFFREPVQSRNPQQNPITIVVEYETASLGSQDYTAGGRAGVKLFDQKLRAGATFVHEGQGDRQNDLYGADARLQLLPSTRLRGEVALTDSRAAGVSSWGSAFLGELLHTTKSFDAKLYLREQQGAFGLGQQPGSEAGTRKLGLEGAYRFDDRLGLSAQAYRQDHFSNGSERLLAETRLSYISRNYSGYVGLLDASDRLTDGSKHNSGQVTVGAKSLFLKERLTLGVDYSQSVWGNGSADFPTRLALRAEYKLTQGVALTAAQELTWGAGAATNNTRVGLRTTLWKGGALITDVNRELGENSGRVFGNIGLKQSWQLNEAWKIDAGAERSQTLQQTGAYQLSPQVPPANGVNLPPQAPGSVAPIAASESFTAASVGASYQVKSFVWDSRGEVRVATSENKWALLTGMVSELSSGWAWSGRAQYLGTSGLGLATRSAKVRLGLVHRPARTKWILLDRLDYLLDHSMGTQTDLDSWRFVNNLVANVRPRKELQLSLGYGAKFSHELVAGAAYQGYTDELGGELRYDLTPDWDVGARASVLHTWSSGQLAYSAGPSVGFSPVTNVWLSVGYNVVGYHDRDFSASNYTDHGPYLRMRFKFDQESVKDAAAWINKQ